MNNQLKLTMIKNLISVVGGQKVKVNLERNLTKYKLTAWFQNHSPLLL